jgi:hypothetical protein
MRDIHIRTVFASAMLALMLFLSLFGVALAADPTADASRAIEPLVVEPGGEVEVTVTFQSLLEEPKAFGLVEVIPDGWEFTRGTDDAGVFTEVYYPEIDWGWITGVEAGATKVVTYTLTVPVDAEEGDYAINGTVLADEVENPVGGDTTITVMEEAPPVEYDLTISSTAGGEVTEPGEGTFSYGEGTPVGLVATASEGYHFVKWTGNVGSIANTNAAATIITMNDDYSISASFEQDEEEPPTPSFCFIATAAYGSPTAEQLDVLREFRDVVLLKNTLGSKLVSLYYQLSPPMADFIAGHELLRTMVRELLIDPIVWVVEGTGNMWRE